MHHLMRSLAAAFPALLLASCFAPSPAPIASSGAPAPAAQAADLQAKGVSDSPPPAPTPRGANVAPGRKLETVDVFVDLADPNSGRQIAPYLLKPEEWSLIKSDQTSPTTKHYRFQRVVTAEGEKTPQIDPLLPKKS